MTGYIERDIVSIIPDALHDMPITVITGMRQTGKSTFLQNNPKLKNRRYVTFDDFAQLESANTKGRAKGRGSDLFIAICCCRFRS